MCRFKMDPNDRQWRIIQVAATGGSCGTMPCSIANMYLSMKNVDAHRSYHLRHMKSFKNYN